MPHDPARIADTRAWLAKAGADLRAAQHDLAASPPLLEDVVFHCQQGVEKVLKGFLLWHDRPFRKTHDLGEIGMQCVEIAPEFEPMLRRAAPLTEYAWRFRYPGDPEELGAEEANAALTVALEVFVAICVRLPSEARPDDITGPKSGT